MTVRLRYSMVDIPQYQAECDLSEKEARSRFKALKNDKHCAWAELVSEDDETYMDVIDGFDNENAHELYKEEQKVKAVFKELFE